MAYITNTLIMPVTGERIEPASDLELARAAAAGDSVAFEKLYEQHHRRVYSLCLRMLGNGSQAEDLTQEVFLQGLQEDRELSRRFSLHHLAAPVDGESSADALSQTRGQARAHQRRG